jgi:glycosyltransferase involved in cell wall biosynthesis
MRIAILTHYFPPRWIGGTEIATYNIASHLAKRGHEVHVMTSMDAGMPHERLENGIHMHRIKKGRTKIFGEFLFWSRLLAQLKRTDPDIIHIQNFALGPVGSLAKSILKKPYIVYGRGGDVYLQWKYRQPVSLTVKNADAVIALTEHMKIEISRLYHNEIFVIPNGINLESYMDIKKDKKEEIGIKLIFIGRLDHIKGIKYLIESVAIIKKNDRKIVLFIVGAGAERTKLEAQVERLDLGDEVIFTGEIKNDQIPRHLSKSDILVLPSLSEGFPNVILEAFAAGLPVIVTKVGGMQDIVTEGVNGFLIEPENSKDIADKVICLFDDRALMEKMSQNNIIKVEGYAWEKIAAKMEEVYMKITGKE